MIRRLSIAALVAALTLPAVALAGSNLQPPAADTNPPETVLTKGPRGKLKSNRATFVFISDEAGASFECRLDTLEFRSCTSPVQLRKLVPGAHTFQVRAIDVAGNVDGSPAKRKFRAQKPPPKAENSS